MLTEEEKKEYLSLCRLKDNDKIMSSEQWTRFFKLLTKFYNEDEKVESLH